MWSSRPACQCQSRMSPSANSSHHHWCRIALHCLGSGSPGMNKDMFMKSADSNGATSTEFEVLNIMIFENNLCWSSSQAEYIYEMWAVLQKRDFVHLTFQFVSSKQMLTRPKFHYLNIIFLLSSPIHHPAAPSRGPDSADGNHLKLPSDKLVFFLQLSCTNIVTFCKFYGWTTFKRNLL